MTPAVSVVTPKNPPEIRTSNRRRALTRTWSSKEWKAARAAFLEAHPFCVFHMKMGMEREATHPHHPYIESYKGGYMDLSRCVPLCAACHTALHHGLNLCPRCKAHYKRWDQAICRRCFDTCNPEVVEAREAAKVQWKKKMREKRKAARITALKKRKKAMGK